MGSRRYFENNGQGLWNCCDTPSIEFCNTYHILRLNDRAPELEQKCACQVVQICKDALASVLGHEAMNNPGCACQVLQASIAR